MFGASTHLTNIMFLVAFVAWTGAAKAIYGASIGRETEPCSSIIVTQRMRYGFVVLGQLLLGAGAVWLHTLGSISEIEAGVSAWVRTGIVGWAVASGVWLAFVSPLLSMVAFATIYMQPSAMAYKNWNNGTYCTTRSRRNGRPEFVAIDVTVTPTGPRRIFTAV